MYLGENFNTKSKTIKAPTYDQVLEWIRNEHKILIYVSSYTIPCQKYWGWIQHQTNTDWHSDPYDDFYQALEITILKVLKTISDSDK